MENSQTHFQHEIDKHVSKFENIVFNKIKNKLFAVNILGLAACLQLKNYIAPHTYKVLIFFNFVPHDSALFGSFYAMCGAVYFTYGK